MGWHTKVVQGLVQEFESLSTEKFKLACNKKRSLHLYSAEGLPCVYETGSTPIIFLCHHFENEQLKIALIILGLATVSEGADVLQLAERFLTVAIEPLRICVCTHAHFCTKTTHKSTDALILTTWHAGHGAGQETQARE